MPDAPRLLDLLASRVVVADGAMGSLLHSRGLASAGLPGPALNLIRPAEIRAIHVTYLRAGARLIETNSYAAGRLALAPYGMSDQSALICATAARLATEAAAEFAASDDPRAGETMLIAGSIGPAGRGPEAPDAAESRPVYLEQAQALADGGVNCFMLETFSELHDLLSAIEAAHAASPRTPIIAQFAFTLAGTTSAGVTPKRMVERLKDAPVAVIGANCGGGEAAAMTVAQELLRLTDKPISIFPNRGLARIDEAGRPQYQASPEYFADHGKRLADMGVSIVGGCCGTTPDDIALLAARVGTMAPVARKVGGSSVSASHAMSAGTSALLPAQPRPRGGTVQSLLTVQEGGEVEAGPMLSRALSWTPNQAQTRVVDLADGGIRVLAEVDPPRGMDPSRQVRGTARLLESGADSITVADNPLSVVRMSNLAMAGMLIREFGANITLHISCRDRNVIGNQSHLLGAASLGITNILAITGDPVATQAYKGSSGVFDLSSRGFIGLIKAVNEGEWSLGGGGGGSPVTTNFCIGTAFNSGARSLENEAKRVAKKVDAGAHFVMTQPVFDVETATTILDLMAPSGVPVFIGVLPMVSEANADFLHNEVPGIRIPDAIRARMKGYSGERGIERGKELAEELIAGFAPRSKAVYLVPPFDRYSIIAHLCAFAKSLRV